MFTFTAAELNLVRATVKPDDGRGERVVRHPLFARTVIACIEQHGDTFFEALERFEGALTEIDDGADDGDADVVTTVLRLADHLNARGDTQNATAAHIYARLLAAVRIAASH